MWLQVCSESPEQGAMKSGKRPFMTGSYVSRPQRAYETISTTSEESTLCLLKQRKRPVSTWRDQEELATCRCREKFHSIHLLRYVVGFHQFWCRLVVSYQLCHRSCGQERTEL